MAILLISLLSLSAVSAADDAATDIASAGDDAIIEESITEDVSNEEPILEESDEIALDSADDETLGVPAPKQFQALDKAINGNDDSLITLNETYLNYNDVIEQGVTIAKNCTIDGTGHTLTGYGNGRVFIIPDYVVVTLKNINFERGTTTGSGGAIYVSMYGQCTIIDCNFTENYASQYGGAIGSENIAGCTAINCIFTNNTAEEYSGALDFGTAINCTFTENKANGENGMAGAMYGYAYNCTFTENNAALSGGAIFGDAYDCNFTGNIAGKSGGAIYGGDATNCTFTRNSAWYDGGAIYEGNAINCTFANNYADASGGAICNGDATNCTFTRNTAWYGNGGGIYNGTAVNCNFSNCYSDSCGGALASGNAINCTFTNNNADASGGAIYEGNATNCIFSGNGARASGSAGVNAGDAICKGSADSCIFNGDTCLDTEIYLPTLNPGNFISTYNDGKKLDFNFTANSGMPISTNIKIDVYKATGEFVKTYNVLSGSGWKVPLGAGTYVAYYNATDFDIDNFKGVIVINKAKTAITTKAITATYNVNKYLTITLKDSNGKALSGVKVTVTIGTAKTYKTDKNGQIKINVANKVPKTYTVKIKYAGNANYIASSKSVKVVVKKATPKMTASAKTFKVKVATKKYTITLKNNKNKVMKNTKVTITINKKTFTAKTNSKGVATFKITNLKKKGKYTATIKYAGSKYYKALSKKATITVN